MNRLERHHYNYPNSVHSGNPATREIRRMRRNTGLITHDSHVELHKAIPFVPVVSHYVAMRALHRLSEFADERDPIKNMENLQRALEYGYDTARSHTIERQVGELAVEAIELQKPYFRDEPYDPIAADLARYEGLYR